MTYQARSIRFHKVVQTQEWQTKVYLITYQDHFCAQATLKATLAILPQWLAQAEAKTAVSGKVASLIVHEGRDGVWCILSWWVGDNMLQTQTYYSSPEQPQTLTPYAPEGSLACVWELAVINHERIAWTNHILKQAEPDYKALLADVLNADI
ncbi:MAG: hypothetical protein Roseis2KO_28020 [Roseivirga sp.]